MVLSLYTIGTRASSLVHRGGNLGETLSPPSRQFSFRCTTGKILYTDVGVRTCVSISQTALSDSECVRDD